MLTVYLEQQNLPTPIETASAAMSGLIAGAIGGVINVLASMALMRATGGAQQEALEQALQNIPNVSPEIMDMVRSLLSGPSLPLVLFAITVPLYAVFGLLGALLGTAFFRKKPGPEGTGGAAS